MNSFPIRDSALAVLVCACMTVATAAIADPASMPANTSAPVPGSNPASASAASAAPGVRVAPQSPQTPASGTALDLSTPPDAPHQMSVGTALRGITAPPAKEAIMPPPDARLAEQALAGHPPDAAVTRGAYLARIGDCTACHTAKNGKPFAGGLAIGSPLGTIYSTNITPDKQTGIGNWSYDDFARLMRRGEVKSGYVVYPAMPYPSYARLTDTDLQDLYAYLMNGVQPVQQPNRPSTIPWPLSMRWPLKIWRAFFAPKPEPFHPNAGMSEQIARGAYLVEGLGHCGACHTPRSFTLQERALTNDDGSVYLSGGGAIDGWIAPSLRSEHGGGLASWSSADIVQFLRTGRTDRTASFGAMNDVVVDSMEYLTDADLASIAAYLKSLGPHNENVTAYAYDPREAQALFHGHPDSDGARIYLDRCAACHRSNGTGYGKAFPALAGNPILQTPDPTSAIHIVLSGSAQPGTAQAPSSLTMAPYAHLLDDTEIARVVTFIQQSWGNRGGAATAEQVAQMRNKATPVAPVGYPAPMQRELRRAEPGGSADARASGTAAGE